MKQFNKTDIFVVSIFTLWGIAQGQVTVFYIIYLFWFQELIRTITNLFFILYSDKNLEKNMPAVPLVPGQVFGAFFILFIYLVFIIVFFGFMLNWEQSTLVYLNFKTLFLKNWLFNANMLLFTLQYIIFRKYTGSGDLKMEIFNRNHIVLHISIILGALIQSFVVKSYPQYFSASNLWGSVLVILPFLLLKIITESYTTTTFKNNK